MSIGVGLCEGICLGMGMGMKECLCMCLNLGQYVSPLSTNEWPKATIWFCGFASKINILLLFEKYFIKRYINTGKENIRKEDKHPIRYLKDDIIQHLIVS